MNEHIGMKGTSLSFSLSLWLPFLFFSLSRMCVLYEYTGIIKKKFTERTNLTREYRKALQATAVSKLLYGLRYGGFIRGFRAKKKRKTNRSLGFLWKRTAHASGNETRVRAWKLDEDLSTCVCVSV